LKWIRSKIIWVANCHNSYGRFRYGGRSSKARRSYSMTIKKACAKET
jgi:hypothetical protein